MSNQKEILRNIATRDFNFTSLVFAEDQQQDFSQSIGQGLCTNFVIEIKQRNGSPVFTQQQIIFLVK